ELLAGRARRIPLQHLVGTAPFYGVELAVGPGVFVPRPETELLVEWGLTRVPAGPATVVDLCSGSGAIALAVAQERPQATVYAVGRAPPARVLWRPNAPGSPAAVGRGAPPAPPVLPPLAGQVALVLCTPPYVPAGTPVPPEVAGHDPYPAVFAGADGLDVIAALVPRVAALLRPGTGWFGVEHDDSQGTAVPELLRADGRYADVTDHPDLAGRPRFTTARRVLAD